MDEAVQRHLASHQFLLGGRERLVGNHDLLMCDRCVGGVPYSGTLQRTKGLADSAAGEAELGFEFVVTIVVDPFGEGLDIAAQALFWLGVED